MKLTCFETVELSDLGKKRKNNEDACLRIPEKGVYCVADGMGGVVGGDLASAAIIDRMRKVFIQSGAGEPETFARHVALFRQAANAASRWIKEFADDKVIGQMGSTLVAIVFDPNNPRRAVGLHAGDSRLYRFRNGQLQLLTADHTAAAALAAKLGRDAAQIPDKFHNELVRAVGLAESVELEKTPVDVAGGDIFLLCSDGLTRMLSEEAISAALKQNSDASLDQVAKTLIAGANEAGGKDNVTVILIRMGDLSGFSEVLEPVDLDEHGASDASAALEGDTISLTRLGAGHTPDPAESNQGHTPQTEDGSSVHGDTPNDDHSAGMRGDTPQTADDHGPPTSATVRPPPASLGSPDPKKETRPPEAKPASPKGLIIGVALAVIAVAGVYFHYRSGSHTPNSNTGVQPQPVTPLPARAPAIPPPAAAAPIPAKQEAPPAPAPMTGGVVIRSEPSGAEVLVRGRRVGVTPYEANGLPAGQAAYELRTMTHTGMVVLSIIGGRQTSTNVMLRARMGRLTVSSDPPGADVWLGNRPMGKTPVPLQLPAGQTQVTLKANGLRDQMASAMVDPAKENELNVVFAYGGVVIQSKPAGAAVKQNGQVVGQTPYTAAILPTGRLSCQLEAKGWQSASVSVDISDHQTKQVNVELRKADEVLRWTNNFGMDFVRLPGTRVWAATHRVTKEQFTQVMAGMPNEAEERNDNGQLYVVNLTSAMTTDFAAKLTEAVKGGGGLPDEIKGHHYAIPTQDQWMQAYSNADKLGIPLKNLTKDKEWCLDGDLWCMAGCVLQGEGDNSKPEPVHKPIKPQPDKEPRRFAVRLMLVP
jgi:protein phosphatase